MSQAIGISCPNCGHHLFAQSAYQKGLTREQLRLLTAVAKLTAALGVPPTFMELAVELGSTKSNAWGISSRLIGKGFLEFNKKYYRSLRFTAKASALFQNNEAAHA